MTHADCPTLFEPCGPGCLDGRHAVRTWTAADPLHVDEEPWAVPSLWRDEESDRGLWLGAVLLLLALVVGFAAGRWSA
jgi:hypothetical protein